MPALLLALPALAADASAPALKDVLHANDRPLEMHYREEKTLMVLENSLTGHGRLRFMPPDTLEREEEGWRGRTYRIQGDRITISEDGRILRQLDLWASPGLAGFATTLRALLAADVDTLEDQYHLALSGSVNGWSLRLVPRREPLSRLIERISIEGDKAGIREVQTYEQGGNQTRLILLRDE